MSSTSLPSVWFSSCLRWAERSTWICFLFWSKLYIIPWFTKPCLRAPRPDTLCVLIELCSHDQWANLFHGLLFCFEAPKLGSFEPSTQLLLLQHPSAIRNYYVAPNRSRSLLRNTHSPSPFLLGMNLHNWHCKQLTGHIFGNMDIRKNKQTTKTAWYSILVSLKPSWKNPTLTHPSQQVSTHQRFTRAPRDSQRGHTPPNSISRLSQSPRISSFTWTIYVFIDSSMLSSFL